MTQIFKEDGKVIIVTVIEAGPAKVVQKKGKEKDGYEALQVGFDVIRKEKNVTRPMMGHFKKASASPYRFLREVEMEGFNEGDDVTVDPDNDGVPDLLVQFDRGALVASIQAGIDGGQIDPDARQVRVEVWGDGQVLGGTRIRIAGRRRGKD